MHTLTAPVPPAQIWSPEGKLLEVFPAIADSAVRLAFLPVTNAYWAVGRGGHVHVYDARGPVPITDVVAESSQLLGRRVCNVWAPPQTDSVFAATPEHGIVQHRRVGGP
jgi:hypothetical protein